MQQTAFSGAQQPSTKSTLHLWASLQASNIRYVCLRYTACTHASGGMHAWELLWLHLHYLPWPTGLVWWPDALLASSGDQLEQHSCACTACCPQAACL